MEKEYTVNDVVINEYAYPYSKICASGAVEEGGTVSINLSSILTSLIQNTGRMVENYASDLFILWNTVEKAVQEKKNRIFVFALRQDGVDSTDEYVRVVNKKADDQYRMVFRLELLFDDGENVLASFGRVS